MKTLTITSNLAYVLPDKVIRGIVDIELSQKSTSYKLEVKNPGPESDQPPEARFSQNGAEVLVLIPDVTDVNKLDQRQRALLVISEPIWNAGERVYAEAEDRLRSGIWGKTERIIEMSGAEMSISRPYRSEAQIEDEFAQRLEPLFV